MTCQIVSSQEATCDKVNDSETADSVSCQQGGRCGKLYCRFFGLHKAYDAVVTADSGLLWQHAALQSRFACIQECLESILVLILDWSSLMRSKLLI